MKKIISLIAAAAMVFTAFTSVGFAADDDAIELTPSYRFAANISKVDSDGYYTLTGGSTITTQSSYRLYADDYYSSDDEDTPGYIAISAHLVNTHENLLSIEVAYNTGKGDVRNNQLIAGLGAENDLVAVWNSKTEVLSYYLDGVSVGKSFTGVSEFAGIVLFENFSSISGGEEIGKVKAEQRNFDASVSEYSVLLNYTGGAVGLTPVSRNTGYVRVSSKQADGSYVMTSGAQNTTDMQYPQYSYNVLTDKVFTADDGVKYVAAKIHAKPTDLLKGQQMQLGGIYDVSAYSYTGRSSVVYTANTEHDILAIYDAANAAIGVYNDGVLVTTFSDVPSFNGFFVYRWFDKSTIAEGDVFETVTVSAKAYTEGTLTDVLNEYLPEKQSLKYTVNNATANGDGSYSFTKTDSSTETTNATFTLSSPVSVYTEGESTDKYVAYKLTLTPKVRTSTSQIRLRFTGKNNSYSQSSTIDSFSGRLPNISAIDSPYEVVAIWDLVNNNDTFYVNGVKAGSGAHVGTITEIQNLRVMMSGASVVDTFDIEDVSATVYRGSYDIDKIVSELIPDGVESIGINYLSEEDGVLSYEFFGDDVDYGEVLVAGYDESGVLTKVYSITTDARGKITGSVTLDDAASVKVFVWNQKTQKSVTDTAIPVR